MARSSFLNDEMPDTFTFEEASKATEPFSFEEASKPTASFTFEQEIGDRLESSFAKLMENPSYRATLEHVAQGGESQFTQHPEEVLPFYSALGKSIIEAPQNALGLVEQTATGILDLPADIHNAYINPKAPWPTWAGSTPKLPRMVSIPSEDSALKQLAIGAGNTLLSTAEQMSTPGNAALMLSTAGGGGLAKAASVLFASQIAANLPAEVQHAITVIKDPNATLAAKTEAIGNPIVQAYLAKKMLQYGAKSEAPLGTEETTKALRETEKGVQNATEIRQEPISNQPEYIGTEAQRIPPESGGGNRNVESRQVATPKTPIAPREEPSGAPDVVPTVTETTTPVPEKVPDVPSVTGKYPAVREVSGEVVVGKPGETHPDIIKANDLKATDIDQRGFVNESGEFQTREQVAAETGLPTEKEPARQHSTDLPEAKAKKPVAPAAALESKPEAKQTWEMTLNDFAAKELARYKERIQKGEPYSAIFNPDFKNNVRKFQKELRDVPAEQQLEIFKNNWRDYHRDKVATAIFESKPVPPEVLADYPDLVKAEAKPKPERGLPESATPEDLMADMTEAGRRAFIEAKSKPDEFSGVDATNLSNADRRNLARLGLSFVTDRKNRIIATYPARMRAQDLREKVSYGKQLLADKPAPPPAAEATAGKEAASILVRINSHRARSRMQSAIGDIGTNLQKGLGEGEFYAVTPAEFEKIKNIPGVSKSKPSPNLGTALFGGEGFEARRTEAQRRLNELKGGQPPTPEIVGMGGAIKQEFPTEPSKAGEIASSAVRPFQKLKNTVQTLAKTKLVRDVIAYTRDAGDTLANTFANSKANEIGNSIARSFPKESRKLAEDALSLVVEAQGNRGRLSEMRQKVVDSTAASAKWKKKFFDAADFALYNFEKLKPIADRYEQMTDAQVFAENGAGIDTLKRKGYVMHAQDISDQSTGYLAQEGEGLGIPFKKVRTHDTFADSIAAGINPKSLNAVDLLRSRLKRGQQLINSRAWVAGLSDLVDPSSQRPITTTPQTVNRADGSTYQSAPGGYVMEYAGFQPIAIHKGYEGLFSALTDPSWFRKNAAGRMFTTANATGKSINLLIDTFHLGRIAFWQSLLKATNLQMPLPSYGRGLTLLDNSVEEIGRMADRNEIPKEWLPELVENKRQIQLAQETGYNVGRVTDALYQDIIHNIPIAGKFNKFLFQQYQRGAMTEAWLTEFRRIRKALPEMGEREAARRVSKDLNTRFGNIGRQGWFKSRSAQDAAKFVALAPQWNEGLIKSEFGAVKQAVEIARDVALGRKVYTGTLLRTVGTMALMQFTANQIINQVTRGKFTWENPEEGIGAKLSAWIPDVVGKGPGFFLHPLGLAAETTHLIMQSYEKTGDFHATLNRYLRSRSSAAMRPVLTFITNKDFLGKTLKPGTVWWETAKSAIPVPIAGGATYAAAKQIITGQPSEQYPGQFQRQAMSSGGIKTDQAPSSEQRIYGLAREFNRNKGVRPSGEFFEGDYRPLTTALYIGNEMEAKQAMQELLKTKSPQMIGKYFNSWPTHPFTGQRGREQEFLGTLNQEQKQQYQLARKKRVEIARTARQLLYQVTNEQKSQPQQTK